MKGADSVPRMGDGLTSFLARHVETFNTAVASGDFAPLVDMFAADARLEFTGSPVGPFEGRAAIADAYAAQPPSADQENASTTVPSGSMRVSRIVIVSVGGSRSGEMRLTVDGEQIQRLVVVFG